MELDRQTIERRDFPIGRRGYDTAAVDAHLRTIALEVEELERAGAGAADTSLASTAGSQVQSILAAAEQAAADIERQAQESAREARESADRDARATREQAIEKARAHVSAVEQATSALLQRVGALDREAGGLADSLGAAAKRLAGDLAALQTGMSELYDSSSGRPMARAVAGDQDKAPTILVPEPPEHSQPTATAPPHDEHPLSPPETAEPEVHVDPDAPPPQQSPPAAAPAPAAGGGDVDGARLVALNMALNGESRADTERYLAENFQLADRAKLVEEVYAAIDG